MLFRIWESINSYAYDERMLQFIAKIAEIHLDPSVSDPARIDTIPDDQRSEGEGRPSFEKPTTTSAKKTSYPWYGVYSDVGIFTENEWQGLMCKCLASMGGWSYYLVDEYVLTAFDTEIPLADSGSLTTGPSADRYRFELNRLPKPTWRIRKPTLLPPCHTKTLINMN